MAKRIAFGEKIRVAPMLNERILQDEDAAMSEICMQFKLARERNLAKRAAYRKLQAMGYYVPGADPRRAFEMNEMGYHQDEDDSY